MPRNEDSDRGAELATVEHANWIAYLTGIAAHFDGARVARVGGAVAIRSDVPWDWLNQVLVEHDDASPDDLFGAVGASSAFTTPPLIRLREGIDDRLAAAVVAAGWRASDEDVTPGMVAHPIDHLSEPPEHGRDLRIRRVTDEAGIVAHRAVVAAGFGVPPIVAASASGLGVLDDAACTVYVGEADGVPVTSGMGWRTGRTIGVYAISTVPDARRRGYGEAMTARVVADGLAAGCDTAILQASSVGRPIYERLGFRVEVRYAAYVRS